MGDRTGRLAAVFGALVALWIVVYWAWEPSDPVKVTFASPPSNQSDSEQTADRGAELRETATRPQSRRREEPSDIGTPPVARTDTSDSSPKTSGHSPIEIALEPASDPVPESGVRQPEFVEYTVRPGDTLERIAQDTLGDGALWTAIARANPLKDPNRIRVGDVLKIPVDPSNIQGTPVGAPPATVPTTVEYTVKTGDTLTGISFAFYGTSRHAEIIFNANRDQLGSMDDLHVGQVLKISPTPGGE